MEQMKGKSQLLFVCKLKANLEGRKRLLSEEASLQSVGPDDELRRGIVTRANSEKRKMAFPS